MFSATKLLVYQRAKMMVLANGDKIQLNQQAHEIQYTSNKENSFLHWFVCAKDTLIWPNVKFLMGRYQQFFFVCFTLNPS